MPSLLPFFSKGPVMGCGLFISAVWQKIQPFPPASPFSPFFLWRLHEGIFRLFLWNFKEASTLSSDADLAKTVALSWDAVVSSLQHSENTAFFSKSCRHFACNYLKWPCHSMWLLHLHSILQMRLFYPVFPLTESTAKTFCWLSLWNFTEKSINHFLCHSL